MELKQIDVMKQALAWFEWFHGTDKTKAAMLSTDIEELLRTAIEEMAWREPIPEGWKLVPIMPTKEMILAANPPNQGGNTPRAIYGAMLAAAPKPGGE